MERCQGWSIYDKTLNSGILSRLKCVEMPRSFITCPDASRMTPSLAPANERALEYSWMRKWPFNCPSLSDLVNVQVLVARTILIILLFCSVVLYCALEDLSHFQRAL